MASAGVFGLLTNDGKSDRLTLATGLLNQRIRDTMCTRAAHGLDPTPTLLDLEKTHVLHMNAHFKPMAALAFEYNKVRASSGSARLGGSIQFSIPQFGDFFHDMVVHMRLGACYTAQTTVPAAGSTTTYRGASSSFPNNTITAADNGLGWNGVAIDDGAGARDAAQGLHTYSLVDAFGQGVGANYRNMVRYVEYPAERIFEEVKFDVNGNPLDDYTWRSVIMMRKFCVSDEKLYGYKKLVGQEVPVEGFSGPRACPLLDKDHASATVPATAVDHGAAGAAHGSVINQGATVGTYMTASRHAGGDFSSNQWDVDHTGATVQSQPSAVADGVPGVSNVSTIQYQHVNRSALTAVDGPQTPKYYQPALELWNRLWFWFNLDARLSVPSVSIPFGQRFITCRLAQASDVVVDFPGIFVEQFILDHTLATTAGNNGSVTKNYRPYWANLALTEPTLDTLELYINNIFVNPEVHDIFIRRVGFSLIRVFREHVTTVSQGSSSELLSQLKWPIEYMFVGFQPTFNNQNSTSTSTTDNNVNYPQDWHRLGKTFDAVCNLRQQAEIATTVAAGTAIANAPLTEGIRSTSNIGQIIPDTYIVERPVVSEISLTAHGIKILDQLPQAFLSSYEPFHYGGDAIRPPKDAGAMMINFALFPGCYQPSGYLNVSRARELYLAWVSSYIGSAASGANARSASLMATAIALNFLLVTDGSAVLRFST